MDQKKRLHSIARRVISTGVGTGERATLTSTVLGKIFHIALLISGLTWRFRPIGISDGWA